VTEYAYNPDGIRTGSYTYRTINGGTAQEKKTTDYLIDPANPTGYAQVLEERTTSFNASDVPMTQGRIHYTIGDDILGQTKSDWTWDSGTSAWVMGTVYDTEYLLVDGQGSTRQLSRSNLSVAESYNYDGYGILLGGNPTPAAPAATKLLYTGEQFDTAAQSYYLRARYYDPLNGRFTQMDPYAGNMSDPQSLHKYLYCHANPVNNIDPSGMLIGGISEVLSVISTRAWLFSIDYGPKVAAGIWAMTEITISMWLACLTHMIMQMIGIIPPCEFVAEIAAILNIVLFIEMFIMFELPPLWQQSPTLSSVRSSGLRGTNDPRVRQAVGVGNRVHYDKTTDPIRYSHEGCPTQLQRIYNRTQFQFARKGQKMVDVVWKGGPHPSTYPNSSWPAGINQADFKPDTPAGNAFKLPPDTLRILYDPQNGQLLH